MRGELRITSCLYLSLLLTASRGLLMLNTFLRAALVSTCVVTSACAEPAPESGGPIPPIDPPPEPSLCNGELDTERAPLQRLTRPQYLNTLSELVGVPAQLPVEVPGDDNPLGFYNGAAAAGFAHASAYRFGAEWAASHLAAQAADRVGTQPECEDPRSPLCITTLLHAMGLTDIESFGMRGLQTGPLLGL